MNPTSNQNAIPGQQPQAPMGGIPLSPMPVKKSSHAALTTILVILILVIMAGIGWKLFSAQQIAAPAEEAAMTDAESALPAPAEQGTEGGDALDSDMALILNSSSESDLNSIDGEF